MIWLENFFNAQTDWKWGWGPFFKYRPSQRERMGLACYLMYGMCIPSAIVFSVLIMATYWWINAPSQIARSPSLFAHLCLWVTETSVPAFGIAAIVGFLMACPYIISWNRRADRLTRHQLER